MITSKIKSPLLLSNWGDFLHQYGSFYLFVIRATKADMIRSAYWERE